MRLFSSPAEELAIKTICSPRKDVAGTMLSLVDRDAFHSAAAKEAYDVIQKYMAKKGHTPTFEVLCVDPMLSESSRENLSEVTKVVRTVASAEALADRLADFRRKRQIYSMSKATLQTLEKPVVDLEELIAYLQNNVSKISQQRTEEDTIFHIGRDDNTLSIAESLLFEKREPIFIPTGYNTFDLKNGGFLRGQVSIIGGHTSSGKSTVAYQTAMNQAALGYKVVVVPLEMGVDETIARMMASVARMENKEIQFQRLTERERDLAWKRWRRFQKRMEEKGGRITLYKPLGEVSMQQVFAALHTYTFDIAYIDYIGLLAGVGGDKTEAQWLQMGNAVRYAKVYADQTKRAVVVLAQVDKEGQLRYSKAMEEHAATTWYFVATKESREAGNLRIEMTKGRNQEIMPFVLAIDYATQHVQDPVIDQHEETASTAAGDSTDASESIAKQSTASKYLDDVTAD